MTTADRPSEDPITDAVLSESAYRRLRYERHSAFSQSVPETLTLLSASLGLLALLFPIYGLYPSSVAPYVGSADPMVAAPKAMLLGAFGGLLQLLSAGLLLGATAYRLRSAPLTEAQAHRVLDTEDFARYVGLGTGGLAVLGSVLLFSVGLGGGEAIASYIATMGRNPFVDTGTSVSVGEIALGAVAASLVVFYARSYLTVRLEAES